MKKKILIIGSGGREHALGWKLRQSPLVGEIYFAPGNGGTSTIGTNIPLQVDEIQKLLTWAVEHKIDVTVVGPEVPLEKGIVNFFTAHRLAIFGPTLEAARLETSKVWAANFLERHNIPHPVSYSFTSVSAAKKYVGTHGPANVVIKAAGLAAGKGVILPDTKEEAEQAIKDMLLNKVFGEAGSTIVIQERFSGPEISLMAFTDGKTIVPLLAAQDHKRIFDHDKGPNTGGMGAYAPVSFVNKQLLQTITKTILEPTIKGMKKEGYSYTGILYAGLMMTKKGPQVLEFNARFGDPETEPLMMLLKSDLYKTITACINGTLAKKHVRFHKGAAACVVLSAKGYPASPRKGDEIFGLDTMKDVKTMQAFHAGTTNKDHETLTSGGRVIALSARGETLPKTLKKIYDVLDAKQIHFDGMHYRTDIGKKLLDGKKLALHREYAVKQRVHKLRVKPNVVSILIGDDAPSILYTQMKQQKAKEVGITFRPMKFPADVSYAEVAEKVTALNNDKTIDGIMFQLPFPKAFVKANPQAKNLIQLIKPTKDIDGMTQKRINLCAAVKAAISILEDEEITITGKQAVVLGASELIGKPLAEELKKRGAIVTLCNSKTMNIEEKTRYADIIICATGVPGILKGDMVSEGVVIIDIGAEKVKGKLRGDVDFASVSPKAAKITPVPGGVGPMTVVSLMENVVDLAERRKHIK